MKHPTFIALALLLALTAPLSQAVAESPPSKAAAAFLSKMPGDLQSPQIRESSSNSVVIRFKLPTAVSRHSNDGIAPHYGSVVERPGVKASASHDVRPSGLKLKAAYVHRLRLADDKGQVHEPGEPEFTPTAPAAGDGASTERPKEENVASLADGARILGVSSNLNDGDNSSEFGALKAIDGLDNTEWASNGDGNDAWVEIGLEQEYNIDAVGFRSRKASDSSGQVSHFTVTTDQGQKAGPFQLPNADRIYYFPVQLTAHALRFNTVETSGGNAGAVAIEAFGKPAQ